MEENSIHPVEKRYGNEYGKNDQWTSRTRWQNFMIWCCKRDFTSLNLGILKYKIRGSDISKIVAKCPFDHPSLHDQMVSTAVYTLIIPVRNLQTSWKVSTSLVKISYNRSSVNIGVIPFLIAPLPVLLLYDQKETPKFNFALSKVEVYLQWWLGAAI